MNTDLDLSPFLIAPAAHLPEPWLAWLGAALGGGCTKAPEPMPDGFAGVASVLHHHGVLPLLYLRLRDGPLWPAIPAEVRDALAAEFQAEVLSALAREQELSCIAEALAAQHVPVVLLKGAALSRLVYDDPTERPTSDVDLLVPRDAVERARRALASLDYTSGQYPSWTPLTHALLRYRAHVGMAALNRGSGKARVELHWSLIEIPYYIDAIDIAGLWSAATPAPGLHSALAPEPAALLIHSCAHLAFHHRQTLRLVWLVDLDRLARWHEMDWQRVAELAGAWRLALATRSVLSVAARYLATPLPPETMRALDSLADDPVELALWESAGIASRRRWHTASWQSFEARSRMRYLGWFALWSATLPLRTAWRRHQKMVRERL